MPIDLDEDLVVDVAIVGGGMMGHYLARQLHDRYSICVVTDPSMPVETLEAEGYLTAGYDGNDVARIQPARRAAGYWRLWAESNGVPQNEAPAMYLARPDEVGTRTRLWTDAALTYRPADDVPPIFAGGSEADASPFLLDNDVVVDPADVLAELRRGIEDRFFEGRVVRFDLAADRAIDSIAVEVGDRTVPIVPRFTVFAASGGNAELLHKVAARFRDASVRRERTETARACQAVRKKHLICIRGVDLPQVSGHVAGLQITSHPLGGGVTAWLVSPPIDDAQTTLGAEDLRFDPQVDSKVVAAAVETLFGASPELAELRRRLEWGVYARRKTEHPMMAASDTSAVGQPAPAKLETFGLESFMALWPSHLSYSMVVGDVAAERIAEALGPRGAEEGPAPGSLAPSTVRLTARWNGGGPLNWHDWDGFATLHDIKVG
ncbi:MAG: FAD-dependent oxidoreductase [Acidimicrobiales bacterium]